MNNNKLEALILEIKKDDDLFNDFKNKITKIYQDECIKNQVDDDLSIPLLNRIFDKTLNNFFYEKN